MRTNASQHRNATAGFFTALLLLLGSFSAAWGQPTDSLIGKTIHLYVQSDDFTAFYLQNGDIPFKVDSKYNYSLTVPSGAGINMYQQDFFISTNGTRPAGEHYFLKLSQSGISANEGTRFTVDQFQGRSEIWIIIDPAGPITAPPKILFEAPRSINILNPWTTTAPKLVLGTNKTRTMSTVPGHCGWFFTVLLDSTITAGHFAETSDRGTYGTGGLGTTQAFDFTSLFSQNGSSIWLNTETNNWSAMFPGVEGTCQYMMAMTIRDFSADHPDFDFGSLTGDHSVKQVVQNTIGPDPGRKPVLNAANAGKDPAISFSRFDEWWVTDSTRQNPYKNYESCYDLPMSKSSDGLWEYDSYRDSPTDHGFWPVEGPLNRFSETNNSCYVKPPPDSTSWVTGGPPRNGNFCAEAHAEFVYQPGQQFAFRGDDDVWVFINDKLVVDLGGVHTPQSDSIDLDKLGLTAGSKYKWDFFYCDRQKCGSSLRIKTSIYFEQKRGLFHTPDPADPNTFTIYKRVGGTGACGSSAGDTTTLPASNLVFVLLNSQGTRLDTLTDGTSYGGINLATPRVSIDQDALTGLVPGTYRIQYWERSNEGLKDQISFTVPQPPRSVAFLPPFTATAVLGTPIPVVLQTIENGSPAATPEAYTLIIPAGLSLFTDAAMTTPAGASSTTGADGKDTLWAAGNPNAQDDATYVLGLSANITQVTLTFTVPPLRIPQVTDAAMFDDDGDGRPDRLVAQFDTAIAAWPPTTLSWVWPAGAASVSPAAGELAVAGSTLTVTRSFSAEPQTQGGGVLTSVYTARGKDFSQTAPIRDAMRPLVAAAEIRLGDFVDTLIVTLSEPVVPTAAPPSDWVEFQLENDGPPVRFPAQSGTLSSDGTTLTLTYGRNDAAQSTPQSGQKVRLVDAPSGPSDPAGNGAGPESRYRVIKGSKRTDVRTLTYREVAFDPNYAVQVAIDPIAATQNETIEQVSDRTGRMGHLIRVDLADYAVKDDFEEVRPENVALHYRVNYFNNLGEPVNSREGSLTCVDAIFSGDCTANRGFLFLGWNMTSSDGRKVGTGAYIARLQFDVRVNGKKIQPTEELSQRWGVVRK